MDSRQTVCRGKASNGFDLNEKNVETMTNWLESENLYVFICSKFVPNKIFFLRIHSGVMANYRNVGTENAIETDESLAEVSRNGRNVSKLRN